MRATITSTNFKAKNIKNNKKNNGRSTSQQSKQKHYSKKNVSKQKKNIQINDKCLRVKQIKNQGKDQYFNKQKKVQSRKNIYSKIREYSSELDFMNGLSQQKNLKHKQNEFNKLKLASKAGVITFDGKIKKIEPPLKSMNKKNKNKSIEYYTDILYKYSISKSKHKKKSKSFDFKKSKKYDNILEKSIKQSHYVLKSFGNSQNKSYLQQTETKRSIQQQMSYKPEKFENIDINFILKQMENVSQSIFKINLLKKINSKLRLQSVKFVSKFCFSIDLNKDVFFLTIYLLDRYINDQITLNKIKMLSLSCLLLVLKMDDCFMNKYIHKQVINFSNKTNSNVQTQLVDKIDKKNKKEQQRRKKQLQNFQNINKTIIDILEEEFTQNLSAQQIIQFQSLILLKQNFRLRKFGLSFWIDELTRAWDSFLIGRISSSLFNVELAFRYCERPQNYYYLVQIIQACLYDINIYNFRMYELILSAMFLICRINSQTKQRGFDEYRYNLQKSSNLLFTDKFGINALMGEFLQVFNIQIGNILPCCKFISAYLNSKTLIKVNQSNFSYLNKSNRQNLFYKHYYNPKAIQLYSQDTQ